MISEKSRKHIEKYIIHSSWGNQIVLREDSASRAFWKDNNEVSEWAQLESIFPTEEEETELNRMIMSGCNIIVSLIDPNIFVNYWVFSRENNLSQKNLRLSTYEDLQKIEFKPYAWLPNTLQGSLQLAYDKFEQNVCNEFSNSSNSFIFDTGFLRGKLIITDQIRKITEKNIDVFLSQVQKK